MCGDPQIDTSQSDWAREEAERARREQEARDARVRRGSDAVDAIFQGGRFRRGFTRPDVPGIVEIGARPAAPAPGQNTNTLPGWGGDAAPAAPAAPGLVFGVGDQRFDTRADAREYRQGLVADQRQPIMSREFAGMDPLIQQFQASNRARLMPDLREQRDRAVTDLELSLGERGLVGSSVHREKMSDIRNTFAKSLADARSRIAAGGAQLRGSLLDQAGDIKSTLRSSADAGAAIDSALTRLDLAARAQPQVDPLGDVFYGASLGADAARRGAANAAARDMVRGLRPVVYGNAGREVLG